MKPVPVIKPVLVVTSVILALAIAVPAEAAAKKRKKTVQRTHHGMVYSRPANGSYEVYFGNDLVGRDPDPAIRSYMQRDPRPWDGPE